ncbi:DUF58 domain-containing protein [Luteimonas terrae]|uniref:Uncharacterized protein (DUF58 family) n=1 Tax=Luteimonas terrae TaxID=1530191 RepID=A0ABU1XTW9_9GAMM|nr:DUF58 domain-containing protein [Luteimonas terrae]MDR7192211.1 uncharacterized protein (DUF58 family) [Luteimonas terrae]
MNPADADVAPGIRPSLAELVALRPLARQRGAVRRARSGARALAPSPQRGQGMEYAESRDYVAGDDARHIDWRVTARTGRPHTKTFQRERERLTLIVADTAAALYFGTRVRFKSTQAARAGAIAAWSAAANGDRVAALRGAVLEAPVAPAGGTRGALRVLHALARWYAQPPEDDAGLGVAMDHARRLLRPGSRLLVLADAISAAAVPARDWAAVGAHCDALVLLLDDPVERQPPRARLGFASDEGRVDLDLSGAAQRARWRDAFDVPRDEAIAHLRRAGIGVESLSSDAASDVWLPAFARGRAM